MASIVCPTCGERFSLSEPSCPVCGAAPRRSGSPELWPPAPARRVALAFGLLIALLIVGALVWMVLTGRRTILGPVPPVIPSASLDVRGGPPLPQVQLGPAVGCMAALVAP